MKKIILTLLGLIAAVITVTACSPDASTVSYTPAAYGQNGQCYYVNSPAEAIALQNAGLCPRSWVPTQMPQSWEEEYYPYYSSPGYYDVYVPARYRTVYVSRVNTFGHVHVTQIRTSSAKARYRSSSGGTVSGTTVVKSKVRFGSGTAGTSFGSGKRSSTTSGTSFGSGKRSSTSTTRTSFGSSSRSFGGGKR